jgi:hypothetical protein
MRHRKICEIKSTSKASISTPDVGVEPTESVLGHDTH